jgi:hypothetical protein
VDSVTLEEAGVFLSKRRVLTFASDNNPGNKSGGAWFPSALWSEATTACSSNCYIQPHRIRARWLAVTDQEVLAWELVTCAQ